MNSEDENFEFHAMVMVGMGYTDDEESGKSLYSTKRWKPKASRCGSSGEREESDENNKHYTVMFNWGDKWGRGGFGLLEKKLIRLCIIP
ncbi:hypothetical protein ACFX16_029179 [Malus domestica]